MLYIFAFAIGGCARSAAKAALFAIIYVLLYAALLFAMSARDLRVGTTSISRVLEHLAAYGAIAFVVIAVGYLCRLLVGQPLARDADDREDAKALFD